MDLDVLCNREIKFDTFLKHAILLGADYVATGHYCRKNSTNNGFELLAGLDENKDQSYFLCQINQEQLSKALFPIGELRKSEVRDIASKQNLVTAEKKDSQGLCFIGKVKLPDFLKQKLKEKKGNVIKVSRDWNGFNIPLSLSQEYTLIEEDGIKIGEHNGAHFYTIGQRKGLNIGGHTNPLFVIQTNTQTNTIFVGEGEDHKGLYRPGLRIRNQDIHWVKPVDELMDGEQKGFQLRIRYRQKLFNAQLSKTKEGLDILFNQPQKAVAKGQFAAWYQNDVLVGSGVIS